MFSNLQYNLCMKAMASWADMSNENYWSHKAHASTAMAQLSSIFSQYNKVLVFVHSLYAEHFNSLHGMHFLELHS